MTTGHRQPGTFSWNVTQEDSAVTLELQGELDLAGVLWAKDALLALWDGETRDVIADLGQLSFMDSTGLRLLLDLKAKAHTRGGRFVLGPTSPPVERVLTVSGTRTHFESAEGGLSTATSAI